MSEILLADAIERQEWLEPVEDSLQKAVIGAYEAAGPAGQAVKNFLHGVWLRHPLHPALTDVPLGSWSALAVLDAMEAGGVKGCAKGADTALKVGLAGAVAAALAGLTDWSATYGEARRVGVTHGLLNLTSAALYTASLVARNRNDRTAGRWLAYTGFVISSAAAWLGGNLVYGKKIGVNHAGAEGLPKDWTPVDGLDELGEAKPHRADVNGVKVLLVRRAEVVYALVETCSHEGGPLAEGEVRGDTVKCPWHGSRFCLRDGSVIDGPATHPQPSLETRVNNGTVEVRARSEE